MLHPPNLKKQNPATGLDGGVNFSQGSLNRTAFNSSLFDRQVPDLLACRRRPFLSQDVCTPGCAVPDMPGYDTSGAEAFYIRRISGSSDCVSASPRLADEYSAIAVLAAPGGRAVC